ncbi:MAG: SRPBCC domain-containing protein [Bacteroidota bacterium]
MVLDKKINKVAIVNASVEECWQLWTTHEGLKSFFGVDNKIDLKPGGAFEIYFDMGQQQGERGGEGNKILSYLPETMLSFSWNAPPSIPEIRNQSHRTWVVLYFKKVGSEHTEVSLSHLGWLEGDKWDETFEYFDRAWDIVMDWFSNCCKT